MGRHLRNSLYDWQQRKRFYLHESFYLFCQVSKGRPYFVVQTVVYSGMRNCQCPKIYMFANPLSIQWVDPRHLLSRFGADTPFRFWHFNSLKDEVAPDLPWTTWPKFVKYIFLFFKMYVFALVFAIARDHFENFICDSLSLPCHIWLSSLASFLPGFEQRQLANFAGSGWGCWPHVAMCGIHFLCQCTCQYTNGVQMCETFNNISNQNYEYFSFLFFYNCHNTLLPS